MLTSSLYISMALRAQCPQLLCIIMSLKLLTYSLYIARPLRVQTPPLLYLRMRLINAHIFLLYIYSKATEQLSETWVRYVIFAPFRPCVWIKQPDLQKPPATAVRELLPAHCPTAKYASAWSASCYTHPHFCLLWELFR